jgi:hypothetical protein
VSIVPAASTKMITMRLAALALAAIAACAPAKAPTGFKVANVAGWLAVAAGTAIVATAPKNDCESIPGVVGATECTRDQGRVVIGLSLGIVGFGTAMFTAFGLK